jgi:hypothetical protein
VLPPIRSAPLLTVMLPKTRLLATSAPFTYSRSVAPS